MHGFRNVSLLFLLCGTAGHFPLLQRARPAIFGCYGTRRDFSTARLPGVPRPAIFRCYTGRGRPFSAVTAHGGILIRHSFLVCHGRPFSAVTQGTAGQHGRPFSAVTGHGGILTWHGFPVCHGRPFSVGCFIPYSIFGCYWTRRGRDFDVARLSGVPRPSISRRLKIPPRRQ